MFNTKLPLYGFFLVSGIILGLIIIYRNSKSINLDKDERIGFILFLLIGAIFGAKYYTLFSNFNENKMIGFLSLGLSSYGAVLGIILMTILFAKIFKKKIIDLLYICIPSIPLMYGIGKIGCFLAGCCHGIEYNGPFSVTYKYSLVTDVGSYFPVQLLEAILFILTFVILMIIYKKSNKSNLIGIGFILCAFFKFICDFLRDSHVGVFLSLNQIVSIIFMIVGSLILICKKRF